MSSARCPDIQHFKAVIRVEGGGNGLRKFRFVE